MPETPRWREAWCAELIRRAVDEPSLLASCPRPVAVCLAEMVAPTGEMPERLVAVYREPVACSPLPLMKSSPRGDGQ